MPASRLLRAVGRVREGRSGPSSAARPVVARRESPTTSTCSARTKAGSTCGTGMGVEASSTARSTTAVGEKIWGTSVGGTIQIGRASRAMGWASDDLPQRDAVLAGQGDVQGSRVGLVLLDGGPHSPGAGLGHGTGQGPGVGGVELAQRDGHVGQGARVETAEVGVGGEDLRQQGGPPAVGELGLELVGLDATGGHIGHEVVQPQGLELGADAVDLGSF